MCRQLEESSRFEHTLDPKASKALIVRAAVNAAGQQHLDAMAVHDALLRMCGTDRPMRSIEGQVSRCRMRLCVQQVCPERGALGMRLNRQSGICPKCTQLTHLNEELTFNETLQRNRKEKGDEVAMTQIRRERERMRQRNSRLCRKFGVKSRRDRRDGE